MGSVIQPGKTALITGAASGVGFAVAKLCRNKGMHLALLDIDEDNLIKAKKVLSGIDSSLTTEAYPIDVADSVLWKKTTRQVAGLFPEIDLVVLNAGKGYKARGHGDGRLNPWLDGDYWKKVGVPSLDCASKLTTADNGHESVWSSQRPGGPDSFARQFQE